MAQLPSPQAAAPASPDPADAGDFQDSQSGQGDADDANAVIVRPQGDGSFEVCQYDAQGNEGQSQTAGSAQEAAQLVAQLLSGAHDPKAAWAAEAASRGPSGLPAQPQMSL